MSVSIINFLIKVAKHNSLFFIISNFFIEKFSVTTGNHYNILKSFKKKSCDIRYRRQCWKVQSNS